MPDGFIETQRMVKGQQGDQQLKDRQQGKQVKNLLVRMNISACNSHVAMMVVM
jgi:hypothetical protein